MNYRQNEEPDSPEEFAVMYQQEAEKLRARIAELEAADAMRARAFADMRRDFNDALALLRETREFVVGVAEFCDRLADKFRRTDLYQVAWAVDEVSKLVRTFLARAAEPDDKVSLPGLSGAPAQTAPDSEAKP
jgi:hypothetical protein